MNKTHDYLLGYDIHDDRMRRRALKILRSESFGYQDSVFELNLKKDQLDELVDRILPLIEPDNDRFFFSRLSVYEQGWQLGTGVMTPRGNLFVIN